MRYTLEVTFDVLWELMNSAMERRTRLERIRDSYLREGPLVGDDLSDWQLRDAERAVQKAIDAERAVSDLFYARALPVETESELRYAYGDR